MPSIFLKDERLEKSPPVIGFKIARYMQGSGKTQVSVFDVVDHFKRERWFSPTSFIYGLTFLYAVGVIDFDEPYLVYTNAD